MCVIIITSIIINIIVIGESWPRVPAESVRPV